MWVVDQGMALGRPSTLGKMLLVAFVTLTVFVIVVRPIARPTGRLYPRLGMTRMSLLSEAPDTDATTLEPPVFGHVSSIEFPLLLTVLLVVLKSHRRAFRPLRLRRARVPVRARTHVPSSH